jgi:integrase
MPTVRVWLDAWVAITRPEHGAPLFRAIVGRDRLTNRRMAPETIADLIRSRACRMLMKRGMPKGEALVAAKHFSGHSLRRGYCTSAAASGVPEHLIRERSRHGSPAVVAKYIGVAQSWKAAGLAGVGF